MQALLSEEESAFFFEALQRETITSIRLNPLKPSDAFGRSEVTHWCEQGRFLSERPSFISDPLFHSGAYYVQESSSMFLCWVMKQLLPAGKSYKVLDLCAAPGGKSTLIASLLGNESILICNESIKSRVKILEENILRFGASNLVVCNNDPRDFTSLHHYFDCILIDAPCSGEGMFRKDKQALTEWSEGNVNLCSVRQKRIVSDAIPSLKPGGFLVYATCTFNRQENEDNCQWMLEQYPLELIEMNPPPAWNLSPSIEKSFQGKAVFRFLPHKVRGEGLFMAVFRKKKEAETPPEKSRITATRAPDSITAAELHRWLNEAFHFRLIKLKDEYIALPEALAKEYDYLNERLNLKHVGVPMGSIGKDGSLIPTHALSLNVALSKNISRIELEKPKALKYLKKQTIDLPQTEPGWHLVTFEGLGLGWVKVLQNRVNNYLPNDYRILKDI